MEVPEQSLTAGLIEIETEKLDYLGDDNVDWDNVYFAPYTSKYSHLAEKEISVEEDPTSTSSLNGRSSHFEDLPSPTLRIGNISTCLDIFVF